MKTKDGIEFVEGMTLYTIEPAEDGPCLAEWTETTAFGSSHVKAARTSGTYSFRDEVYIDDCYADRAVVTLRIVSMLDEEIAQIEEYRNKIMSEIGESPVRWVAVKESDAKVLKRVYQSTMEPYIGHSEEVAGIMQSIFEDKR